MAVSVNFWPKFLWGGGVFPSIEVVINFSNFKVIFWGTLHITSALEVLH